MIELNRGLSPEHVQHHGNSSVRLVDSFDTTIGHIGELKIPLAEGKIVRDDVLADLYEMESMVRRSDDEITLFKNGGGAHLDLMTARYILDRFRA